MTGLKSFSVQTIYVTAVNVLKIPFRKKRNTHSRLRSTCYYHRNGSTSDL